MPLPTKYTHYTESAPTLKLTDGPRGIPRSYTAIWCPTCKSDVVDIPTEQLATNKANRCLKHELSNHTWTSLRRPVPEDPGAAVSGLKNRIRSLKREVKRLLDERDSTSAAITCILKRRRKRFQLRFAPDKVLKYDTVDALATAFAQELNDPKFVAPV